MKKFKFRADVARTGYEGIEYEATEREYDYLISWESNGSKYDTTYSTARVDEFIADGGWIVVPEVQEVEPTLLDKIKSFSESLGNVRISQGKYEIYCSKLGILLHLKNDKSVDEVIDAMKKLVEIIDADEAA